MYAKTSTNRKSGTKYGFTGTVRNAKTVMGISSVYKKLEKRTWMSKSLQNKPESCAGQQRHGTANSKTVNYIHHYKCTDFDTAESGVVTTKIYDV